MTLLRAVAIFAILAPVAAWAQSDPSFYQGQVPSATEWNGYFADKTDYPLKSYVVADLPTCNSTRLGAMLVVTDATTPTYNAALTGGGAVVVPVMCDGSAWKSH